MNPEFMVRLAKYDNGIVVYCGDCGKAIAVPLGKKSKPFHPGLTDIFTLLTDHKKIGECGTGITYRD